MVKQLASDIYREITATGGELFNLVNFRNGQMSPFDLKLDII